MVKIALFFRDGTAKYLLNIEKFEFESDVLIVHYPENMAEHFILGHNIDEFLIMG